MNIEKIAALFTLFSGEADTVKYMPLINSAVCDVLNKLRKDADLSDDRIAFLCAAVANLRYINLIAQRDCVSHTYAGTSEKNGSYPSRYLLAKNLVRDYWICISDLLDDSDFLFIKA